MLARFRAPDTATFLGLRLGQVKPLLEEYPSFRGPDGVDLIDIEDGILPDPDTPAPPRFLPPWDACLLVHARRSGILPEEYRPLIFNTKMPQSVPTFLIDGRVAGTWRFENSDISVSPFKELERKAKSELGDEREGLRRFHS